MWRAVLAVCAGVIVLFAGSAVWQASRALRLTENEVKSGSLIRFTRGTVERAPAAGFEILQTPASFTDAIPFNGHLAVVAMAIGALADGAGRELLLATSGEGLLAYDGSRIRQIRADTEARRTLTALLPLPNGSVLMGTAKSGVLVYDGNAITPLHPSLSTLQVTALAGDAAGLWVGTIDQGVFYFHAGEVARFSEPEGVPDQHILSLAVAGDRAYAGTTMGVVEFERGKFRRVLAPDVMVRSLLCKKGALLVGTMEDGLVEVALEVRQRHGVPIRGSGGIN